MAGVFVVRDRGEVRVAVTGAAACVFRHEALERALQRRFEPVAIEHVDIDSTEFNEDLHASAAYRGQLVRVMAMRAVEQIQTRD